MEKQQKVTSWKRTQAQLFAQSDSAYGSGRVRLPDLTLCPPLAAEVAPFGIRVHLVLPGSSGETRFRETARAGLRGMDSDVYGDFMKTTIARMAASTGAGTHSQDVAEAVWQAATDPASPLRIPAGADAVRWAAEAG